MGKGERSRCEVPKPVKYEGQGALHDSLQCGGERLSLLFLFCLFVFSCFSFTFVSFFAFSVARVLCHGHSMAFSYTSWLHTCCLMNLLNL